MSILVGLDEAGVGPGFGSVWASAVVLPESHGIKGLDDSKKLTPKKRDRLRSELKSVQGVLYGMGEVDNAEVDSLGLGEARRLVFDRALVDLFVKNEGLKEKVEKIIVDGTIFRGYADIPFECVPRADSIYPCVSAASILAKTERDYQVDKLCDENPELEEKYDIRRNKGYLTPRHIQGIRDNGLTSFHRKSYKVRGL